ncbi:hypothetical protein Q3G72_022771 [Acer saccharum]|nr:hypothetical protein Q3G72_017799 [Acer saccharum]KAK1548458.1 hypothetical protein Q3G72_022771 [Acer saccharum]
MPLIVDERNYMLTQEATRLSFMSLHTADPGTSGASEATGGSPAYARKGLTWGTAASGSISATQVAFDAAAGSYSYVGFWSAATSGTFRGGSALATAQTLSSQGVIQVFSLAGPDGTLSPFDPDGTLQVSPEPAGLFIDDFSGALTTNWTTGGTAPTVASGVLTTSNATTASASSYMRTIGSFQLRSGSYLLTAHLVRLEATALVNNTRWWGFGTNQASPTAAAPVLNGAVFLLDYSNGGLYAATYSNGTRLAFTAITRPSDGAYHRYEIRYRQSVVYWIIDGVTVATVIQPNLAVAANLPVVVGSANFTTAPTAAPSLSITSSGVSDLSATHRTIGDGVSPWIQATVKAASTTAAATDLGLVTHLHPNSPLPSGTNRIGSVYIGSTTSPGGSYYTSTGTNAATVAKASAGDVQQLVITNTAASTQYVKLYNATTVTLGTTAAIATFPVAATSTLVVPLGVNGLRMTAGIAYSVTGGLAATDNTAGAGGVLIALTYV